MNNKVLRAKKIHGDKYDYSNLPPKFTMKHKVEIICPIHGKFFQTFNDHIYQKCGCPSCKNGKTHLNNDQFLEKCKNIYGEMYDYSKINYINRSTKIKVICLIHGEFLKNPRDFLNKSGCPKCGFEKIKKKQSMLKDEFIKRCLELDNQNIDYSNLIYDMLQNKVRFKCKTHGYFWQLGSNHLHLKQNCPKCSHVISKEETKLLSFIKKIYGGEILTNVRNIIAPLEIDVYLPELKIAIEYNGIYWHSEIAGKDKKYHLNKTQKCRELGINLIHINSYLWEIKQDIIKGYLIRLIKGVENKIYARKCIVKNINRYEAKDFTNKNHLQGHNNAKVCLGMFYNNNIVAVMTFGKSRFGKKYEWELIRYSIKNDTIIIGGPQKMFKHFINNYNPKNIVSYCDMSIFKGKIYKLLGFKFSHISNPNYWYFENCNTNKIYSRVNFQKHKLKDKLGIFKPNLTEWENMKLNGWNRYWDCGNSVWVWDNNAYK